MIKVICFDLDGVFFTKESFKIFKSKIAELTKHTDLIDEVLKNLNKNY